MTETEKALLHLMQTREDRHRVEAETERIEAETARTEASTPDPIKSVVAAAVPTLMQAWVSLFFPDLKGEYHEEAEHKPASRPHVVPDPA